MKKNLFGKALVLCLIIISSMSVTMAYAEDIDDIQWYNTDGTIYTGVGSYQGQVVSVTGTVFVPDGTYNTGTFYSLKKPLC